MGVLAAGMLLAMGLSGSALADESVAQVGTVSTTTAGSTVLDTLKEKANLSLWSYYRGGALTGLGDAYQPGVDGAADATSPQSIEGLVTAGYKFDKDNSLNIVPHFFVFPGKNEGSPGIKSPSVGLDAQMLDPAIQFTRANLINSDGFKLKLSSYVFLPVTSNELRRTAVATALEQAFNLSYDAPSTRLTLGWYGYLKGYIASADSPDNVRSYKLVGAPYANYQLTPKLAATVWVDLIGSIRQRGSEGFIAGMQNSDADIEPGFNWDITDTISLNPFLNIYPNNPTMAATSLQAVLTAKAF